VVRGPRDLIPPRRDGIRTVTPDTARPTLAGAQALAPPGWKSLLEWVAAPFATTAVNYALNEASP
jgi:hypothetical protein